MLWGSRDVRSSVVSHSVILMVGGESVRGCGFRVLPPGKLVCLCWLAHSGAPISGYFDTLSYQHSATRSWTLLP